MLAGFPTRLDPSALFVGLSVRLFPWSFPYEVAFVEILDPHLEPALSIPNSKTQIGGGTHKEGLKHALHSIFDHFGWSE